MVVLILVLVVTRLILADAVVEEVVKVPSLVVEHMGNREKAVNLIQVYMELLLHMVVMVVLVAHGVVMTV
tara:strand:- start:257 stop:466 length:210 start_codon:yes stop_codon:yes gene_type:complete